MLNMIQRLGEKIGSERMQPFKLFISLMFEQLNMNRNNSAAKDACSATIKNEATAIRMAYSGTFKYQAAPAGTNLAALPFSEISGCGHHGPDYVGVASLRAGKGKAWVWAMGSGVGAGLRFGRLVALGSLLEW
eukprot:1034128-Rhodomonas_salina.1